LKAFFHDAALCKASYFLEGGTMKYQDLTIAW
jgi:hypothetical protein